MAEDQAEVEAEKKNPNETNSRTIEHFNVMVDYKSDGVGGRAAVQHALYPIYVVYMYIAYACSRWTFDLHLLRWCLPRIKLLL